MSFEQIEYWTSLEDLMQDMLKRRNDNQWYIKYIEATTYLGRLKAVKEYYLDHEQRIIDHHSKGHSGWYNSYLVDWTLLFTPIEREAWNSIRCKGRIVLYPQYPVLNYHLDFGNPFLKIGLELDGKDFHNPDKDRERDLKLKSEGWVIYHIKGSEMMRSQYKSLDEYETWETEENFAEVESNTIYWLRNTGDGVIESIKRIHFIENISRIWENFLGTCQQSLEEHTLI